MIYHITTRDDWEQGLESGIYTTPSLDQEGFIHASTREQVAKVGNAFYRTVPNCVLLAIDEARLPAPPVYEPAAHPQGGTPPTTADQELFPHIYGPIPVGAVVKIADFIVGLDGMYSFPAELEQS
jgi:uncharacterized protein (DUF952 family)